MLIIAPSKNTFQNISAPQNRSLKKCISEYKCLSKMLSQKYISEHKSFSKLLPQKIHFKTFIIKFFFIIIWVYAQ